MSQSWEEFMAEHRKKHPPEDNGLGKLLFDLPREAEAQGYAAGRRAGLEDAAAWLLTCPPHLSLQEYAAGIRALIDKPLTGEAEPAGRPGETP